jgi:hypothetical protein
MKNVLARTLTLGALAASIGCGDNPRPSDDEVGNDSADSVDADNGESGSADDGMKFDFGLDSSDSDSTDETADTIDTADSNDETADSDDGPDTKFDLGGVPDNGFMNCQGDGDAEF